jgi:hypothetical protein
MISIKPIIRYQADCPYCKVQLKPKDLLWHGMHICAESHCPQCGVAIIGNFRTGHGFNHPYRVDLERDQVFSESYLHDESIDLWLGKPLLESLQNPNDQPIEIKEEIFKSSRRVIILNCIDFLYGHSLLKLLNADACLKQNPDFGLVVIIQKFLRWMVPDGCSEIWTVDIPLRKGRCYYSGLHESISEKLSRFDEVYLSEAYSHPSDFDITHYTKVPKYDFDGNDFRITFIWREDRAWLNDFLSRALRKFGMSHLSSLLQNWKVRRLFNQIKRYVPSANFTVAGLGKATKFPAWIDDVRVERFDEATERRTCEVYHQSRLVVGIHGSNMLLPSAHAGMTLDLMPTDRLANICQDIIYQETDPRLASFRYRFPQADIKVSQLAKTAVSMVSDYEHFIMNMLRRSDS